MVQGLGPLLIDIGGLSLGTEDKAVLKHPLVGGVILFARNYQDRTQLQHLCQEIKSLRSPELLIAVDQEGGRVQRFKQGMTLLPSFAQLARAVKEQDGSLDTITDVAWLMAAELSALGVDLSFSPVVDVDIGVSNVIGDRSFGADADVVANYALAFLSGLKQAGFAGVAKHFPGHGSVSLDSHYELPIDSRDVPALFSKDLSVFKKMIAADIAGIMSAHVCYSAVDEYPATFSQYWLRQLLRREFDFKGFVFSDDLTMKATYSYGNAVERFELAHSSGCDIMLVCNARHDVENILTHSKLTVESTLASRMHSLFPQRRYTFTQLEQDRRWLETRAQIESILDVA